MEKQYDMGLLKKKKLRLDKIKKKATVYIVAI